MTPDERAAFRRFVRTHHPDVGGDPEVFRAGLERFRARTHDDDRFDAPIVFVSNRERRRQAVERLIRKLRKVRNGRPHRRVQ